MGFLSDVTDHGDLLGLLDDDHPQYSLVDGTRPFTGPVGGVTPVAGSDLATREYVDLATAGIGLEFFFTKDASDVGGYYVMQTDLGAAEENFSANVGAGENLIASFATVIATPSLGTLKAGSYHVHIHAKVASVVGTKDTVIFARIYTRTQPGGVETLQLTTESTGFLTASDSSYELHAALPANVAINATDRFVVKLYATVSGSGADPTYTVYVEGSTDAAFEVPTELAMVHHDVLAGLGDDDHTIYIKADGTRDFVGTAVFQSGAIDGNLSSQMQFNALGYADTFSHYIQSSHAAGSNAFNLLRFIVSDANQAPKNTLSLYGTQHVGIEGQLIVGYDNPVGTSGFWGNAPVTEAKTLIRQTSTVTSLTAPVPTLVLQNVDKTTNNYSSLVFASFNSNDNLIGTSSIFGYHGARNATWSSGGLIFCTTNIGDTGPQERMRILPSGSVLAEYGLHVGGTSDPGDNNLIVDGTITTTGRTTVTFNDSNLTLDTPAGSQTAALIFADATTAKWNLYKHTDNTLRLYDYGAGINVLHVGGGLVGINTVSGAARLSINGGLHVGGDTDPGDNNLNVDGTIYVNGKAFILGANDSGGAGYRTVKIENA